MTTVLNAMTVVFQRLQEVVDVPMHVTRQVLLNVYLSQKPKLILPVHIHESWLQWRTAV